MSNTLEFTLGLDLAQASFDAALAPQGCSVAGWRDLPHTHFELTPDSPEAAQALLAWLGEVAPQGRCLRVVVESTGKLSRRVARALNAHGLSVAIINPRRSKAFGHSLGVGDKTDRIDCAILGLFGLIQQPAPTPLASAANEELRELSRLRQTLVEEQTAWKNRLGEADSQAARKAIEKMLRHLGKQVEELEKQIDQLIDADPALSFQVRALRRIKGIGPVIARTLTAELGDLRQYSRAQLVALAGLFPRQFESGTSVRRRPRLAKGGGSRLRRVLYMGATSLFASTGPMREWIQIRLAQGQPKMAVEAMAMRKLLLIARAVMINGGHYDPAKIGWQKA
jgi:transposase